MFCSKGLERVLERGLERKVLERVISRRRCGGLWGRPSCFCPRITLQPLLTQTRHGCLERQGLGQCYSIIGKALLASPRITLQPPLHKLL